MLFITSVNNTANRFEQNHTQKKKEAETYILTLNSG